MEKYYLAGINDVDLNKRIKLVEITYSRKAPSFGVVYVSSRTKRLHLKALQLTENNEACFEDLKRSHEPRDGSVVVDYDTSESLSCDENQDTLQCIVLTSVDNSLSRCQLMKDGAFTELEMNNISNRRDGLFQWCRLKCEESQSYIHLLSHKSYFLVSYRPNINALEQVTRYSLLDSKSSNHLTFTGLHLFPSKIDYSLLELSDKSLRIISGERGYLLINLDLDLELGLRLLHFIFPGDSSNNALLVSYSHHSLTGHSLTLNQTTSDQKDPDGLLLAPQSSVEVEKCWTIDLDAIESLRTVDEDETDGQGEICLSSFWSWTQISAIHGMSKYLVAGIGSNLLVYSFESLADSTVPMAYDRFFMKDRAGSESVNPGMQVIDQKIKPALVDNFRLTGTQTTDAMWNTIFSASGNKTHLVSMHHFQQMGLLVGLTNNGHLLSFRFDSNEIPAQKDNLYQQQVADSLRGSSALLLNTIQLLQDSNSKLKQELSIEATRMLQETHQLDLANLISATLAKRPDVGAMYSLNITISDLIQIRKIVITSSVNSSFIRPTVGANFLESLTIDNNYSVKERGILLADADQESSSFQQKDTESIIACALMNMKPDLKNVFICVPIFMMDGKRGSVKIYFLLNGRDNEQSQPVYFGLIRDSLSNLERELQDPSQSGAFMLSINLRTLHSYQQSVVEENFDLEASKMILKITGSFSSDQMLGWLNKCIVLPPTSSMNRVNISLFSRFTCCFIKLKLQDGQLELSSDDMFAREMVKKQVLEEATGSSIKLDVKGCQGFDDEGLNHLLRMQHRNLEISAKMPNETKKEDGLAVTNERDLLLELVTNEMNLSELRLNFKVPSEDETIRSLRNDIETEIRCSLDKKAYKSGTQESIEEEADATLFRSLICGYILDCMADFDKFKGLKVDEERLVSTQPKLLQLLLEHPTVSMDSFVARVRSAWRSAI